MSKVSLYVLAIMDNKTPDEARVLAGYESSVPSSAIELARRVMLLRKEVNAFELGWDSVASLKRKTIAARKRAHERIISSSIDVSNHDTTIRSIEMLESWRESKADPS